MRIHRSGVYKVGIADEGCFQMKYFTLGFIVSSLLYLLLTAILGILFLTGSAFNYGLMVATVHTFLLGFVTMLIFGVNYHIIPIFSGRHFYSPGLAYLHLIMGNMGILGFIFPLTFSSYPVDIILLTKLSAIVFGLSILVFIYNMLRTLMSSATKEQPINQFG